MTDHEHEWVVERQHNDAWFETVFPLWWVGRRQDLRAACACGAVSYEPVADEPIDE